MKILMTVFGIMDIGGIGPDIDWKIRGLEAAGHEVDIIMLRNVDCDMKYRGRTRQVGATEAANGLQIHPRAGFFNLPVVGYGSKSRIRKLHKGFEQYDGIIHEIPGPNPITTLDDKGYWSRIYEHDVPQIISAHDANFRLLYPHLIDIADRIQGISCTNQAGYATLSGFPAPRAFIGAPHPVYDWSKQKSWNKRKAQAVSAHVWKAWKHMDYCVRSIPFLKNSDLILCGDGIERHYMTSTSKVKPRYKGIWKKAEKAGMDFRGMLPTNELHDLYRDSRVIVDMAWSKKFMSLGCHFNRSIIEGYNNGCVPIVVSENMNEDGFQRRLFKEGETHFEIAAEHTPKELAELVDHVSNLSSKKANAIINNGREILLQHFDYRKSSLEFLKLLKGKPAGVYPKLETGKATKAVKADRDKFLAKVGPAIAKKRSKSAMKNPD